jgi:hypothetical protein
VRAGLLSQPKVIQRINGQFVSTTITFPEMAKLAKAGDELAGKATDHWSPPVTLMFLNPEGGFLSKLDVLKNLTDVHPDTAHRPGQKKDPASLVNNTRVFLEHLDKQFGAVPLP